MTLDGERTRRALASSTSSHTVPTAVGPAPHRHSVLLVEDDLDSREALKEYLRLEGFRVAAADDGESALGTLRGGFVPCVILLDMNIPRVDGEGLQRERRRQPMLAKVPVIVVSGNDRVSAPEYEVAGAFVKPLDLPALRRAIDDACAAERR